MWAWMAAASCVSAGPSQRQGPEPDELRLWAAKALRIPVEGCLTASFSKAHAVLQSSNLLEQVQQAYAAQLPVGKKPEFEVMPAGEGRYYYVNKDDERCDIRELWRSTDTNTSFQCAFYVTGERFFGRFESLITLRVTRSSALPPETLSYVTDVRICPHSAAARVLLRHMPGIELYFRKKADEMRRILATIFTHLAGPGTG